MNSASAIITIFDKMDTFTGIKVNESKSKVYFSKGCKNKEENLNVLKLKKGNLPIKYLGIPLSSNKRNEKDCFKLYDSIQSKLEGW